MTHAIGQWLSTKVARQCKKETETLLTNDAKTTRYLSNENHKLWPYFIHRSYFHYTEVNIESVINFNVKAETIKLPEENIHR